MTTSILPQEEIFNWDSKRLGMCLRAPMTWGIDNASDDEFGLPGNPSCVVLTDRWGGIRKSRDQETEHDDPNDTEVYDVVPRSLAFSIRELNDPMELKTLCKETLKSVLSIKGLSEIDGNTNLRAITVGRKAQTQCMLAGRTAFGFSYSVNGNKSWEGCYVIGTYEPTRKLALLVTIKCQSSDVYTTLPQYAIDLSSHFGDVSNLSFYEPGHQVEDTEPDSLFNRPLGVDAKWTKGVMTYRNPTAAIAFELPAYPMTIREGVSLTRSNPSVHIYNLTIILKVHPPDIAGEEEIGMTASHQPVEVSIGIDIEDTVRAKHPTIMSAAEYGTLKMKVIMHEFANSKPSGTPLTNFIGNRNGVSYLWTGNVSSELRSKFCKAMCCVTLNNNKGIVVSYFTRTGQGLFDMNLHIMQDLLKDIYFIPEREADGKFSRDQATSILLQTSDDFSSTFEKEGRSQQLSRYVFLASCSTGGALQGYTGASVIPFPSEVKDEEEVTKKKRNKKAADNRLAENDTDSVIDVSDIPHFALPVEETIESEDEGSQKSDRNETPEEEQQPDKQEAAECIEEQLTSPEADASLQEADATVECNSPEADVPTSQSPPPTGMVLKQDDESDDEVTGVSLKQIYTKACSRHGVKSNSRLLQRLPTESLYAFSIEELDLSLNYFGKGFEAACYLFKFMPKLRTLQFNEMSIGNEEVRILASYCEKVQTLTHLSLRSNPRISLASSKPLLGLLKKNQNITSIELLGTSVGNDVVKLLNSQTEINKIEKTKVEEQQNT